MDEIKFYKVKHLPSVITPAHDGIYFVKGDGETDYKSYIISDGIVTNQKITLDDVIPYIGANKAININIQDFIANGKFLKGADHFDIKNFTDSTTTDEYLHKYSDLGKAVIRGNLNPLIIRIPVRHIDTLWSMEINLFDASNTYKLLLSAQGLNNITPNVHVIAGNSLDFQNIKFGKDGFDNVVLIIPFGTQATNLRLGIIDKFYHTGVYHQDLSYKTNYKLAFVAEENIPELEIHQIIDVDQFNRDGYNNGGSGGTVDAYTKAEIGDIYEPLPKWYIILSDNIDF